MLGILLQLPKSEMGYFKQQPHGTTDQLVQLHVLNCLKCICDSVHVNLNCKFVHLFI